MEGSGAAVAEDSEKSLVVIVWIKKSLPEPLTAPILGTVPSNIFSAGSTVVNGVPEMNEVKFTLISGDAGA